MTIHLRIWRQAGPNAPGRLVPYTVEDVSPDMSFLEMLDVLNEHLIAKGEDPVAFDSDCREGICGTCGFVVSGIPHGPDRGATVCQLHLRRFKDGDTVTLEPWRAKAFPVIKDLVVDRSAFDRLIQAGGYTSINTGGAADANATGPSASDQTAAATSQQDRPSPNAIAPATRNPRPRIPKSVTSADAAVANRSVTVVQMCGASHARQLADPWPAGRRAMPPMAAAASA